MHLLPLLLLLIMVRDVERDREAIVEGVIDARHEGVGIVNPGEVAAEVTVSLEREDQVLDEVTLQVGAGDRRLIRMDRLFIPRTTTDDSISFRASQPVWFFGYDASGLTRATPQATGRKRRAVRSPSAPAPTPQTVALTPSKDNTLFQSTNGSSSNGQGIHLFAGMTASEERRRALVAFDVASQIRPGSQVTRAELTIQVSFGLSGSQPFALHRVTADWGQGTSNAGSSRDGGGAPAQNGDATWIHRFRPAQLWTTAGGDFAAAADATAQADFEALVWQSSPALIARVQGWLDQPSTNFGWIVIGKESGGRTAKRLDSREVASATSRPTLTIEYIRP